MHVLPGFGGAARRKPTPAPLPPPPQPADRAVTARAVCLVAARRRRRSKRRDQRCGPGGRPPSARRRGRGACFSRRRCAQLGRRQPLRGDRGRFFSHQLTPRHPPRAPAARHPDLPLQGHPHSQHHPRQVWALGGGWKPAGRRSAPPLQCCSACCLVWLLQPQQGGRQAPRRRAPPAANGPAFAPPGRAGTPRSGGCAASGRMSWRARRTQKLSWVSCPSRVPRVLHHTPCRQSWQGVPCIAVQKPCPSAGRRDLQLTVSACRAIAPCPSAERAGLPSAALGLNCVGGSSALAVAKLLRCAAASGPSCACWSAFQKAASPLVWTSGVDLIWAVCSTRPDLPSPKLLTRRPSAVGPLQPPQPPTP